MKRYKVGNTSGSARGRLANKATRGGHPRGYRRRGSTLASGNARRPEHEHACASSECSDLQNPRPPFAQFTRARGAPPLVFRCGRLTYIQRNLARGFDLHQLTVNAARSFSFALSRTPLLVLLPYLNARNDGVCPSKKRASLKEVKSQRFVYDLHANLLRHPFSTFFVGAPHVDFAYKGSSQGPLGF